MKITGVEAIYVRQKEVKIQCDSGQDALIVKVTTDAGITGIGEVDSNPLGAKGIIEGPFSHTTAAGLASLVIGEDPFETEKIWHKMYRGNIYGGRRGVGRRPRGRGPSAPARRGTAPRLSRDRRRRRFRPAGTS